MSDLVAALGLVLVIEGIVFALFPDCLCLVPGRSEAQVNCGPRNACIDVADIRPGCGNHRFGCCLDGSRLDNNDLLRKLCSNPDENSLFVLSKALLLPYSQL